jgi:hypothetical protein
MSREFHKAAEQKRPGFVAVRDHADQQTGRLRIEDLVACRPRFQRIEESNREIPRGHDLRLVWAQVVSARNVNEGEPFGIEGLHGVIGRLLPTIAATTARFIRRGPPMSPP